MKHDRNFTKTNFISQSHPVQKEEGKPRKEVVCESERFEGYEHLEMRQSGQDFENSLKSRGRKYH